MKQEYVLGQLLKERYVNKLINSSYKFSEVWYGQDKCLGKF